MRAGPDGRTRAAAVSLGGAIGLGLWSLRAAFHMRKARDIPAARRVLGVSILWIPLLFAVLVADRLIGGA